MSAKATEPIILIADDDPDDQMFLEKAIRQHGFTYAIEFVEDGEQLMDYLYQKGKYQQKRRPTLLILDLNMPRKNGFQALDDIKQDASLKRLPVLVLTTSSTEEDIIRSYDLGVNAFMTKPFDYKKLVELIGSLKTYWLDMAKLP